MDIQKILEKEGIPAYTSGSFTEYEIVPSPVWIFTNMMTDNYYTDKNVSIEVLHYTIALYSNNPDGLRDKVKDKQKELIELGAFCGGIVDLKTLEPTLFGYGFECTIIQKY